jgi:aspartate carbamoyltransferase regulatory subunit|tara:strand:+ start:540 stop:974 length:435 start_codon:yes stop_codon:yes gene_type:complete
MVKTNSNLLSLIEKNNLINVIDNEYSFKKKTNKEKLLFSIEKEINLLNDRDNLKLRSKTYFSDKHSKNMVKVENRFWRNSENENVSFNLKYKGKIVPIKGMENKSFSCKNNVETLINSLSMLKGWINDLDDSNGLFDDENFGVK